MHRHIVHRPYKLWARMHRPRQAGTARPRHSCQLLACPASSGHGCRLPVLAAIHPPPGPAPLLPLLLLRSAREAGAAPLRHQEPGGVCAEDGPRLRHEAPEVSPTRARGVVYVCVVGCLARACVRHPHRPSLTPPYPPLQPAATHSRHPFSTLAAAPPAGAGSFSTLWMSGPPSGTGTACWCGTQRPPSSTTQAGGGWGDVGGGWTRGAGSMCAGMRVCRHACAGEWGAGWHVRCWGCGGCRAAGVEASHAQMPAGGALRDANAPSWALPRPSTTLHPAPSRRWALQP